MDRNINGESYTTVAIDRVMEELLTIFVLHLVVIVVGYCFFCRSPISERGDE